MKHPRYYSFALALIATAVVFFLLGKSLVPVTSREALDTSIAQKVWEIIQQSYLRSSEIDQKDVRYGLAKGVMNSLGDQHSVFFDPDEAKSFLSSLNGELEGIGAELKLKEGTVYIVTPLPDSPAVKAGIRPGDIILKVNGQNLGNVTDLSSVVMKIRGPKGTKVTLTILHEESIESEDIEITRAAIHLEAVTLEEKEYQGKKYPVIKIGMFSETVASELEKSLQTIEAKGFDRLILDLRFNGGGYLDQAIEVLGYFLPPQTPAVFIKDRLDNELKKTKKSSPSFSGKIVLIMNEASASASEIVAGALKDHKRATLIGTKTFGKGTVQEVRNLSDGSALRLTIAEWLTPEQKSIENEGINPDVLIKLDFDGYKKGEDNQLNKALEILSTLP